MRLINFPLSILLSIICFSFAVFSQDSNTDICEVFSVDTKTEKETKLGSFTTEVSEGFQVRKSFKLPKTKIYVTAAVNYEDDLVSQKTNMLADSIHLALLISTKKDLTEKDFSRLQNVISMTEMHFIYDDYLYPVSLSLITNTSAGKQAFYMTCKQNTRTK